LNGSTVRSSHVVRVGDRIRWRDHLGRFEHEVEVLEIPLRNVSRAAAREMVRVIEERRIEDPWA
jgi:ribosomal 50S subunit-recycling heat shock protein